MVPLLMTHKARIVSGLIWMAIASCGELYAQYNLQVPRPSEDPEVHAPEEHAIPEQIEAMPQVGAEMDVIRRRSQLVVAKQPIRTTAIADPGIIDVVQYSPTEISVIGLRRGATTLTMWFDNDPNPLIYQVNVVSDPSLEEQRRIDYGKLEEKLRILFPNSKVYLIPFSNKILVKGEARDAQEAAWILQIIRGEVINQEGQMAGPQPRRRGDDDNDYGGAPDIIDGQVQGGDRDEDERLDYAAFNIINMMTVPGEYQVMLRVRIAELNRSRLRQLGVDWTALINDGRHVIGQSLSVGAPTLTGIFEAGDIEVLISALRSHGYAHILTEPNLTVLSGHDATVLSGGEFAVPTIVGIDGVGGQQTVFRGFGVSVVVNPTILNRDLIRMRIRPEFSEIDDDRTSAGGIPGLQTRRVDTTVQLREGQTIVLAGLLSHRTRTEVGGIPVLDALPLVGPLVFASKKSTMDETELLILVTPEIVRPMEADEVPPVPGFETVSPEDYLLFKKGFVQGPSDTGVYQLAPYGHGSGQGVPIGYGQFNPAPASPRYSPVPSGGNGPMNYGNSGGHSTAPRTAPRQNSPTPYPPVPESRNSPEIVPAPPEPQHGPSTRRPPAANRMRKNNPTTAKTPQSDNTAPGSIRRIKYQKPSNKVTGGYRN